GRGAITNGYYDMVMLSYSPDGELRWDISYDGAANQNDEANGIVVTPDGSTIYVVGGIGGLTGNGDVGGSKYSQAAVGIHETTAASFSIYPNPAKDRIHIQLDKPAAVSIYTATGQLVETRTAQSVYRIDISEYPAGLYLVASEGVHKRFVKE